MLAKVGNDYVGAGVDQAGPLPLVDAFAGCFVRSDADGETSRLLAVDDLDVTVAEGNQLFAGQAMVAQDLLNDHRLGKALRVVQRAVDPATAGRRIEERGQAERIRLVADVRHVGATGQ